MRTGHRHPGRAFTVVELLVAIAVVAIIATGLATIFGSVGDAVTEGRRVSEINRAAARIEQQIRDDLSRLTRDGFLVIAHRYASDEDGRVFSNATAQNAVAPGVRLTPQDTAGRARRADEIMFFARGDFQTRRATLAPGMIATSGEAAVYYGIGQKRTIDFSNVNNPVNFYFNPSPRDANLRQPPGTPNRYRPLLGKPELPGRLPNPNRYARDWSLLRQVTLLAEPRIVTTTPAEFYGMRRNNLQHRTLMFDSFRQIAMQPSARSLFNSLSWTFPGMVSGAPGSPAPDGQSRWWIGDAADFGGGQSPSDRSLPAWRASGVVDIAQGSILGVRRELEALATQSLPSDYYPPARHNANPAAPQPADLPHSADGFRLAWNDPASAPRPADAAALRSNVHGPAIRAWALDMMPSLWDGENGGDPPRYLGGVRYEDLPTRLVLEPDRFADSNTGRLARAIAEANQEMLTSQVFVPHCSEFIVEWSYGEVDENLSANDPDFKRLIWFGLPRADRDVNGDGRIDLDDHADANFRAADRYRALTSESPRPEWILPGGGQSGLTDPEVAVFGLPDANGNPVLWPRFIRITMSLADPDHPATERTFQFVFAVPGQQG